MKFTSPQLQGQILFALVLGVFCGLFFGELVAPLERIGLAFIMLLKMSILPYMSVALIHAIGSLSLFSAKILISKTVKYLLLLWTITITTIYSLTLMFPDKETPSHFTTTVVPTTTSTPDFLRLFIPVNPLHAMANDIVPAVVLFSLLFGVALMRVKRKAELLATLETIIAALISITKWVIRLSPIGVFALIASKVGTMTLYQFEEIQLYIIAYVLGSLFLALWLFPKVVAIFTPVSYREFMGEIRTAVLLSFTTANNLVVLPQLMHAVGEISKRHNLEAKASSNTVETMMPIAYNFPTAGNLFVILFVLFLSFFYSQPLAWVEHLKMSAMGVAVLFGSASSAILGVSFLVDQMHLPIDGFTLFIQTMPLTRNFQTMMSSVQIATLTLLICFAYQKQTRLNWRKLIPNAILTVVLFLGILSLGRALQPIYKGFKEPFSGLKIKNGVEATVYDAPPRNGGDGVRTVSEIQNSGVLRVGYNIGTAPFAYRNRYSELVGYDMALAHRLAEDLGTRLELIPFRYRTLAENLDDGVFDIAMSAITATEDRLTKIRFSDPYITTERVLVAYDHLRHRLADYDELKDDQSFRVAFVEGTVWEEVAMKLFPEAQLVSLSTIEDFLDDDIADAILWSKEEGTTWALMHPQYTAVTPEPSLGQGYYAYAFAADGGDLQEFVNYWIDLKALDGYADKLYDKWILGHTPVDEPRWSVIRDVLHWIQ